MKKLPKTIIVEHNRKAHQDAFDGQQAILQENVKAISELMNLKIESVEQLEGITPEWLDGEILKSKNNLKMIFGAGGGFIPEQVSSQFSDNYEEIRFKAQKPIASIQSALDFCKQKNVGIKIDSNGKPWLNEKEVKENIEKASTYTFTEEDSAYYTLLGNVFDALNEVRKYEKQNGLSTSELAKIISNVADVEGLKGGNTFPFEPKDFLTLKLWGKILKPKENL